jgi:metallo-beta-lactamase class B
MSIQLLRTSVLALSLSIAFFTSTAQQIIKPPIVNEAWAKEYKPFRLAGNLYWVGTYDLASYLITTPKGHILINTGLAGSASVIKKNIESLGFKFSDIKLLFATHAHYDHVGAIAEIKKQTGATLYINENDATVMEDGGNSDYAFGGKGSTFAPVKVDSLLHGNDTVNFGGQQIIILHHPGHTKGASSFLFNVKDDKRTYKVLIANMPTVLEETKLSGMPTYPNVAKDYAYTISELKKLKFDLWFASHASQFNLHTKHKPDDPYNPSVFIDRKGYDEEVSDLEKAYLKRLKAD